MDTENYIYEKFFQCIENWEEDILKDIYALSFLITYSDDDLKKPELSINFNTFQNLNDSIKYEADRDEAKWNFLFKNNEFINPNCKEICKNMMPEPLSLPGIIYNEIEGEKDPMQLLDFDLKIADIFTETVVRTAERLHNEGDIVEIFGKTIPIIIHETVFDPEMVIKTKAANPLGIADEFAEWAISRYIAESFTDWKKRLVFLSESNYEGRFYIYDYLNDMDHRQILEEWLMIASEEQRYEWYQKIIPVDSILKKITEPVKQCIWGEENGKGNNWDSSKNWWYYRRPKEVSGWGWE